MASTRELIDKDLEALQRTLPAENAGVDQQFDFVAFQERAQAVADAASPEDRHYAQERVTRLLAASGLIPSDIEDQVLGGELALSVLKQMLDDLDRDIPLLQRQYGSDFWNAFAGQADVIEDNSGKHAEFVGAELGRIMDRHGLGDETLPGANG